MVQSKKSQSLSTDIVIVVVVVLFGALFLIMNKINQAESAEQLDLIQEDVARDSNLIIANLKETNVLSSDNSIDTQRLLSLSEEELKQELGIKNDFAIVFEKDGKLVKIDSKSDVNCIGSSNIVVNEQKCK